MENNASLLMERYELGRLLGSGTFAKVFYARNIATGQAVAIKMIDKDKAYRVGLYEQIKREITVMRLVKHPNIVQLYEVMATKSKIYFALEYVKGGELFVKVAKGKLKEDVARKYFMQLINAIDFCHTRGAYHRDLKPENLLLDENENLKISDFGLSALAESRREDGLLHTTCGTPAYVAPEVVQRNGYDGAKADIWSCGVVLYVLLAGYLPFHDSNLMELYRKVAKAEYKCPSWFPPDARRLIVRMLDPNPNTRISIARIREHPWFKRGVIKAMKSSLENNDIASSSTDAGSLSSSSDDIAVSNFNAFDIISRSPGFDLSRLFEEPCQKKESRFTSWKTAKVIISKLEEIAKMLKMKATKREGGLLQFEGMKEGKKGTLSIDAEIFEVTPTFHMVEIKKSNGDTLEYKKVLDDGLRPGLKDIVWVWQGDRELLNSPNADRQPQNAPNEDRQPQASPTEDRQLQASPTEDRQPQDSPNEDRKPQDSPNEDREP